MSNIESMPQSFVRQVAAQLRARAAQGQVSQVQLAEATGISQSQVSKILRGVRIPDLEQTFRLCYVLGLEVNAVISEAYRYVMERDFPPMWSILDEDGDPSVFGKEEFEARYGRASNDPASAEFREQLLDEAEHVSSGPWDQEHFDLAANTGTNRGRKMRDEQDREAERGDS